MSRMVIDQRCNEPLAPCLVGMFVVVALLPAAVNIRHADISVGVCATTIIIITIVAITVVTVAGVVVIKITLVVSAVVVAKIVSIIKATLIENISAHITTVTTVLTTLKRRGA